MLPVSAFAGAEWPVAAGLEAMSLTALVWDSLLAAAKQTPPQEEAASLKVKKQIHKTISLTSKSTIISKVKCHPLM